MLLHHFLDTTASHLPDKEAIVVGPARLTWAQLWARAGQLAALLQSRNLRRGDRIAVFADNSLETVIGLFAALRAGGIFMLVNPLTRYSPWFPPCARY
jgi:long-chain acyl-CoA synthetase